MQPQRSSAQLAKYLRANPTAFWMDCWVLYRRRKKNQQRTEMSSINLRVQALQMVEKLDVNFKTIHNTKEPGVKSTVTGVSHDRQSCFPPTTTVVPSRLASSRSGCTEGYATSIVFFVNSRLMATNPTQRMPLDGDHIFYEHDDQSDDESLFGSPPPPPGTGRSLSLALPSGGLDSEQNVGTLALPGSHNPSKLPVHSAVSLLDARHHPFETQSSSASTSAQTTTSRAASLVPTVADSNTGPRPSRSSTNGALKKRKRAKKSSNATSTLTPGPSIQLPPSDAPFPPNFLRNQQALLGIAGLVANINPASLSARRHNQGNDPHNPIVVDDAGVTLPRSGHSTVPTPAQLLTTLSAQRDLFPVLEQLLNILRRGADPSTQPPPTASQPLPKRRKLSRVPAGAADWDVPFPFPPGEGPPNYKEEWTNERCERLITDFLTLLREGANKAAARGSAKRATSQPAPQPSMQSHSTSTRWSVPPTNWDRRSPSSNYVPLPLDAYLRPTLSHSYAAFPPTPTTTESPDGMDLLASMFGAIIPPQDNHLPNMNTFEPPMDPLSLGFDVDPLLLDLIGSGSSQEGLNGMGSPPPFSEEAPTPALSHSPSSSQSIASGPSPMTPNFDPSFVTCAPSPSDSVVSQRDRVGIFGSAPHLGPQDGAYFSQGESLYEDLMKRGMFTGLELGVDVDDDLSRVFGMGEDAPCGPRMANQPPHFCDTSMVGFPTFPGSELFPQGFGIPAQAVLSSNMHVPDAPLPFSVLSQGAPGVSAFFAPQQDPLPSSPNIQPPAPASTSLQRQRPVPKRPALVISPSKDKAVAAQAVTKKRREDTIQQARDLRRQLLADIGKSKVQLWELTMEQGVLTRMSKDERLRRS